MVVDNDHNTEMSDGYGNLLFLNKVNRILRI